MVDTRTATRRTVTALRPTRSPTHLVGLAAILLVLHVLAFLSLHRYLGSATGTLAALPIVLMAWHGGAWIGVAYAVLLMAGVTPALHYAHGAGVPLDSVFMNLAVAPAVAFVIGRLREVRLLLQEELAQRSAAETRREASETRLRVITEHVEDVIWMSDQGRTRCLYVSPAYERVWGASAEALLADPSSYHDMMHPDDRTAALAAMAERPHGFDVEYRIVRTDGAVRWIHDHSLAVTGGDGAVECLVGVARDITDRRRLDDTLQASREQFRQVVDNLTSVVFETDADGRWTFLNGAWTEITGFPVATTLGNEFITYVHPDDRGRNAALFAPLIERKKEYCRHEIRYQTAAGGSRWVEVHARPLLDGAGNVRGTAGTLTDVTQRREMEDQLHTMNRRYESVLSLSPAVLYVIRIKDGTPAWDFVSDNAAEQFGYTPAQLLADPDFWMSRVHPEDAAELQAAARSSLQERGVHTGEFRVLCADGTYRWVRDTAIAIKDAAGRIVEIVGSWTDATEARGRELHARTLAAAEAARGEAEAGERRLHGMLERISDGFFSVDAACRLTFMNAAAEWVFGGSREQLLGEPIADRLPELHSLLDELAREAGSEGQQALAFDYFDPPTGRWYAVRAYSSSAGASVFLHDITRQREAEAGDRRREALHAALNRLSARFAASTEADFDDALRELGEAAVVNRSYLFSVNPGGLTLDNTHEWCAPGTESVRHTLQGLPAGQFAWLLGELEADRAITRSSIPASEVATQSLLDEQGIQSLLIVPVRSAGGDLLGFMGFDDTTKPREWNDDDVQILRVAANMVATQLARREAERALRRSERDYRGLFEHAHDAILILDPDDETVLEVNPRACELYGLTRDAFIGVSLRDMSEDPSRGAAQMRRTLDSGCTHFFETVQRRVDGSEVVLEVTAAVIDYRDRRAVLSINRDITARRSLERQLRQAQKMEAVGQLAGGVAHDFNNMLTAIGGYTQLLLMDTADPQQLEVLGEIARASDRAAALTHQLLAFSRRQMLQPTILNLNQVVTDMSGMLGRLIGEAVVLNTVLADELSAVKADAGQLQQVLMNLAVNARDAMPDGGELTIETCDIELTEPFGSTHPGVAPGAYVLLAVTDTGCGMDAASRERIFEPFYTTKAQGKGTGLGLSTVYGIVKQSGGHIFTYSEVGHGSTFRIYLPRVMEEADSLAAPRLPEPLIGGSETILLVEDEPMVRHLARAALEKAGYVVTEAGSAAEALDAVAGGLPRPDLLITDVVMPGINGRAMAERLQDRWPGLRVLYMSGYTDDAIIRHGVLQPGVHFIHKPFTPSALARQVRIALGEAAGAGNG
jgi:two-component system, cell cycle sensor histidine kinase and response regulator CckA